jgi:hypothetical protein
MKPGDFKEVLVSRILCSKFRAAKCMNIRAALKVKYGGSTHITVVPVLIFNYILNTLFNNVSLLDNVALVTDELMRMECCL